MCKGSLESMLTHLDFSLDCTETIASFSSLLTEKKYFFFPKC